MSASCPAGVSVGISASGIGRTVGTIASDAENGGVFHPGDACRGTQCKLLIAAALPLAGQPDDGFPARDKGQRTGSPRAWVFEGWRPACCPLPAPDSRAGRSAGRACIRAQLRASFCRAAEFPYTAGDHSLDVVQRFSGFPAAGTPLPPGFTQTQPVFLHDPQGICAGGTVRHSRPGCNHVQPGPPGYPTGNDRINLCGSAGERKPAAFDTGKAFADGVHFDDIGAAAQQLVGDILQFFTGTPAAVQTARCRRRIPETGRYPPSPACPDQIDRRPSRRKGVPVGHRMPGFKQPAAGDIATEYAHIW